MEGTTLLETAPKTVTPAAPESNFGKWMALTAALLGWMFDGFEMGLFPLIGGPALNDLLGPSSAAQATQWFGAIIAVFLVGAATGGVFFGWLGDRIGRVRAMSLSIFTYAIFTGLCGFATEAWHIAALRFIASLGMGGEWSLGVALVNEIWPDKSRALIAGLIGAAANVGFLMVGLLSIGLLRFIGGVESLLLGIGMPTAMVERLLANSGWRFLMISGALPALHDVFHPAVRARIEEVGARESARRDVALGERRPHRRLGRLSRIDRDHLELVAGRDGPGAAALITAAGVAAALWGFLFPVRRYLDSRRLRGIARAAPATPGHQAHAAWRRPRRCGAARHVGIDPVGAALGISARARPEQVLEGIHADLLGARRHRLSDLVGVAAGRFGRRITYAALCVGSILSCLLLYQGNDRFDGFFLFSIFLAGGITAGFYGLFPLYLPELFPTVVRATGQGFAYNFGRILAAVGGLQTATLMGFFGGSFPMAGSVLTVFYAVGLMIIWFGPETLGKQLPE